MITWKLTGFFVICAIVFAVLKWLVDVSIFNILFIISCVLASFSLLAGVFVLIFFSGNGKNEKAKTENVKSENEKEEK